MASRRTWTLAALLACAAVAAGCGSSSSSSSSSSGPNTGSSSSTATAGADQFIAQADQICTDADKRFTPGVSGNSPTDFARKLQQQLVIGEAAIAKLKGLTPPADKRADWDSYLALQNAQDQRLHQTISALQAGDVAGAQTLIAEIRREIPNLDTHIRNLGITACLSASGRAQPSGSTGSSGQTTT